MPKFPAGGTDVMTALLHDERAERVVGDVRDLPARVLATASTSRLGTPASPAQRGSQ